MGLGDIKKKILADAEGKKAELLQQAEVKASEIIEDYKKRADDYRSDLMERAEADGQGEKRGIVIDAHLKVKNELLLAKRADIEAVFVEAEQKFKSSSDYPSFLAEQIAKFAKGDEEVIFSSEEKKLGKKWLDDLNKKTKFKLTVASEKGNFRGGVILKSGDVFLNMTLETLLNEKRELLEKGVAEILFS